MRGQLALEKKDIYERCCGYIFKKISALQNLYGEKNLFQEPSKKIKSSQKKVNLNFKNTWEEVPWIIKCYNGISRSVSKKLEFIMNLNLFYPRIWFFEKVSV